VAGFAVEKSVLMAKNEESLSEVHIGNVSGGIHGSIIAGRDVVIQPVEQAKVATNTAQARTYRVMRGAPSVKATASDVIACAVFGAVMGAIIGMIEGAVSGILVSAAIPVVIRWTYDSALLGTALGVILGIILGTNCIAYPKRRASAWMIVRGTILGVHKVIYRGEIVDEHGTWLGMDFSVQHRTRLGTIVRGAILGMTIGAVTSGIITGTNFVELSIGWAILGGAIMGTTVGAIVGALSWATIEKMGLRPRISISVRY
jgi:hypothetical protein